MEKEIRLPYSEYKEMERKIKRHDKEIDRITKAKVVVVVYEDLLDCKLHITDKKKVLEICNNAIIQEKDCKILDIEFELENLKAQIKLMKNKNNWFKNLFGI